MDGQELLQCWLVDLAGRRHRHTRWRVVAAILDTYGQELAGSKALARLESRIAFEELRARYPRYNVDESGLRRVHMANVAGFSHVPVAID